MRKVVLFIFLLTLGITFQRCGQNKGQGNNSDKLKIVATTGMIADLLENIGKDRVSVTGLMGPGVDPHLYKASHADINALSNADIIFYTGLRLEGKMTGILEKMSRQKSVIPLTEEIPKGKLLQPEGFAGNYDPHIWFDVALWTLTIEIVVDHLSEIDPEGEAFYRQNGSSYRTTLDSLHTWVQNKISSIPEQQRVLVTAHRAFGYFGQAYDIDVVGLQGISTVAEFGVNDVRRLVDLIIERQVRAIFVESSVPERSINAVREACKSRGFEISIGGTLYTGSMGGPGSGADTYVTMVQHNVNTIVDALLPSELISQN
ncbi:MAG: manganese transporter [Candidatus Marinimicrobia bacterium]|nr:manganese transporter [Candidatus Neomarinimicrobiota bacterium]